MNTEESKYYIIMYSTYVPYLKEGTRRNYRMETFKGRTEKEAREAWADYTDVIEYGKYFTIENVYGYIDSEGNFHRKWEILF